MGTFSDKKRHDWCVTIGIVVAYIFLAYMYYTNIAKFGDIRSIGDAFTYMFNYGQKAAEIVLCGMLMHIMAIVLIIWSGKGIVRNLYIYECDDMVEKVIRLIVGIILCIINVCFARAFIWIAIAVAILIGIMCIVCCSD